MPKANPENAMKRLEKARLNEAKAREAYDKAPPEKRNLRRHEWFQTRRLLVCAELKAEKLGLIKINREAA